MAGAPNKSMAPSSLAVVPPMNDLERARARRRGRRVAMPSAAQSARAVRIVLAMFEDAVEGSRFMAAQRSHGVAFSWCARPDVARWLDNAEVN